MMKPVRNKDTVKTLSAEYKYDKVVNTKVANKDFSAKLLLPIYFFSLKKVVAKYVCKCINRILKLRSRIVDSSELYDD